MSNTVISVEHLSKSYRLGQIGTGTLTNDMKVWFARKMGKPNPLLKIGQEDHGNRDGETIWALNDVSFTVEQGEVLGIIGRNGAGKSTLLKILSRVTAPTSGVVKVKGRIASLLEVGTGFHPDLTGRENIYLNGAILGMTRQEIDRKFDEIVDFAEIEKFIDTPVKRYSSGMYVRLAFAVAAHLESEILLVDEVLAVGDAEFQKKCLGKMGDVASKEGRTVLFVSHNMGAIAALCSKSLLLRNGLVMSKGGTNEVVREYLLNNVSSTGKISFPQNTDQQGKAFIRSIEIRNSNGVISPRIFMEENAYIETEIFVPEKIAQLSICIYMKTSSGIPIIHTFNEDSGVTFNNVVGLTKFRAEIPGVKMYPGSYSISLWIGDNMGNGYDHKKDCCMVDIEPSLKFHRRNLTWDYGIVRYDFVWSRIIND